MVEKGEGFTKKEAKRRAAALMLKRLKIEDIDKQVRDLRIPIGRQVGDLRMRRSNEFLLVGRLMTCACAGVMNSYWSAG